MEAVDKGLVDVVQQAAGISAVGGSLSGHAAKLLFRLVNDQGWCAGPEFPGNTIRRCFVRLERLGYLLPGTNTPSPAGQAFVRENHLTIQG